MPLVSYLYTLLAVAIGKNLVPVQYQPGYVVAYIYWKHFSLGI